MSLPLRSVPVDPHGARVPVGLHLQVQEIAEQDWLLAILASTAETNDLAKTIALGTALLAEVADVAGCAFIDSGRRVGGRHRSKSDRGRRGVV
jgi:hypothetical protein